MAEKTKERKKLTAKQLLCIALALMLISTIGTVCMQSNWGKARVSTFTGTLAEVGQMIRDNNQKNGKNIDITFTEDNYYQFSFMTMIPKSATASNPAPAIICSHGGSNTKEMQMNGYVELVRRGFVVISIDAGGHGHTDNAIDGLTGGSLGMLAAAEYAKSLDCVIEDQIGVTGHSMGNQSCFYTIAQMNVEGSDQRIAAWVEGAGTMLAPSMTPELAEGLTWILSVDYFDEFDTVYFDSPHILTSDLGKNLIRVVYPDFNAASIVDGQWFTKDGPVDTPAAGQSLGVDTSICLLNPPITHPMFHFSKIGTAITIDGFYTAFGTPAGNETIPSSSQVWPVMVAFELIGLIGFFMLLFPLVAILIETPLFSKVRRKVADKSSLPSAKKPVELLILVITLVALILFAFFTYGKYYPNEGKYLNAQVYAAGGVANGIGLWTIMCGLFAILMIIVGYAIKKLTVLKSGEVLANPFESAGMDSVSQFLRTILFSFTVVVLMYIPVYIAYYLNADFRICSLMVQCAELNKIPLVLFRYIPMWLLFYVPNAILNANTRYNDLPDWLTTVICAVANCVALIIFVAIQYTTLFNTSALWKPDCGMAGIVAFAVIPCLAYAAFSARYIYKKTGNAWAAGIINGTLMCCITCFASCYGTDLMLPF